MRPRRLSGVRRPGADNGAPRPDKAVGSLDDVALSEYTRTATFETVVGKVKFGEGGGWAHARVLTVQFQNIKASDISEFRKPDTQAVVYPREAASAEVIYPY